MNAGAIMSCGQAAFPADSFRVMTSTIVGNAAWTSANLAIYIPFAVDSTVTVKQVGWYNGTVNAGNTIDVGIYTEAGVYIISSGAQTMSGAGLQVFNITDTVINPGVYFMGMSVNTAATGTFGRGNQITGLLLNAYGVQQQASAHPLPTTSATFANPTNTFYPVFGLLLQATA